MDRIDAMSAFVTVVEIGGLAAAARRLGVSPASITRAVAMLEDRSGAPLLRRTTRSMRLTEAGERYVVACRRILADIGEAERAAAGESASPRGVLSITAPVTLGRLYLRPIVDAFLAEHDDVRARLLLLDRAVGLVDEGIDVALRVGSLPDTSLVAVKVGEVRRVVVASPAYLARARAPKPRIPGDLAAHACVSFGQLTPSDRWPFARARSVRVRPRLAVNSADAAIASVLDGRGVTVVLSYQVERELEEGRLLRLLPAFEPEPAPVQLVYPAASAQAAKLRAFLDRAVPALRRALG